MANLSCARHLVVNDMLNSWYVKSSCGNVGCQQQTIAIACQQHRHKPIYVLHLLYMPNSKQYNTERLRGVVSAVMVGGLFLWPACDMELVTGQYERPGHQQRLLQTFLFSAYLCT